MPWPTTRQDLFEYVSSHMTLEAMIKAEIKRRSPDEPRAAGKRPFGRERRKRAQNVTEALRQVQRKA